MTENTRRVVITGLGLVSPVGSTVNKAWDNIKNGVSGIRKINSFDASSFSVQIAGSVIDFNAEDFITPKDQKKMDTFIHYGIGASAMAIKDAGLEINDQNKIDQIVQIRNFAKLAKKDQFKDDEIFWYRKFLNLNQQLIK